MGFPLPPPRGSLVARCLGQSRIIDFPSDQQVVAPILTLPRLAGRSEANCRFTISVAFLPQLNCANEYGRKHSLKFAV